MTGRYQPTLFRQTQQSQFNLKMNDGRQCKDESRVLAKTAVKAKEEALIRLLAGYQFIQTNKRLNRNYINRMRAFFSQVILEQLLSYARQHFNQLQRKRERRILRQSWAKITMLLFLQRRSFRMRRTTKPALSLSRI